MSGSRREGDQAPEPGPGLAEVRAAGARIAGEAHRTPVLTCASLDRMLGCRLHFKCENFQKVGAFKFRGATNAVRSLPEETARRGVVTHSSGNHAQALALAAARRGVPATIVMPRDTLRVKREAVEGYGARVVLCEPTLAAREEGARQVLRETGGVLIHPYDDDRILTGAGTAALELLEEVPELDVVMAPVGGGGLLSGTCLAAHGLSPGIQVFGAEPTGADDAFRSLAAGRIIPVGKARTVADGLRTSLGERTFPILQRHVAGIVTVPDEETVDAMRLVWERMKLVIEPSAAVALAAVARRQEEWRGLQVGVILSGGNADLDHLPW